MTVWQELDTTEDLTAAWNLHFQSDIAGWTTLPADLCDLSYSGGALRITNRDSAQFNEANLYVPGLPVSIPETIQVTFSARGSVAQDGFLQFYDPSGLLDTWLVFPVGTDWKKYVLTDSPDHPIADNIWVGYNQLAPAGSWIEFSDIETRLLSRTWGELNAPNRFWAPNAPPVTVWS